MNCDKEIRGFTLTEMAIVLVIVALLIGGLALPLSTQQEMRALEETQHRLTDASEALTGFAAINGRLPCPATTTSQGQEDCAGSAGNGGYYGYLPAAKLGLPSDGQGRMQDGWQQPLRYAVSGANFGGISTGVFVTANGLRTATLAALSAHMGANPLLSICTGSSTIVAAGTANAACDSSGKITDSAAAVVYSTGKNTSWGGQAGDENHNPNPNSGLAPDPAFVHHTPTPAGSAAGEFVGR
ncbi:hypothetical protein DLREEDagrD3_23050 [Denitratisoma sp. agr-D3]